MARGLLVLLSQSSVMCSLEKKPEPVTCTDAPGASVVGESLTCALVGCGLPAGVGVAEGSV